jgi:glutathione S-transferase
MKLYEFPPTRSIRVRWTLQELGLDFESIPVDLRAGEHRRPEFLALNPAGKIPVLVDGEFILTESVAIVLYLAEKHRGAGFLPADVRGRAAMHRWLLFATTELEQPLWRIARNTFIYPEHERIAADVEIASREFREMAAVAEEHLLGRDFLVGDSVTVADFVMAYTLDWGSESGLLEGFPALVGYMERMYARPRAPQRIAAAMASVAA